MNFRRRSKKEKLTRCDYQETVGGGYLFEALRARRLLQERTPRTHQQDAAPSKYILIMAVMSLALATSAWLLIGAIILAGKFFNVFGASL